jgi:hypothetical protein
MEPAALPAKPLAPNTALAALLGGAVCIALSPIWVRIADVGPTASAFWRVFLAVPLLWILFFSSKETERKFVLPRWRYMVAAGIAFAGDLAFRH